MEASTQARFSFRDFLTAVFKRKNHIFLFFIITVGAVVSITFLIEPKYRATTQLLVKIGRQNVYNLPSSAGERIVNSNLTNQINSAIELLKSRSLAEKALNKLGPYTVYPMKESPDGEESRRPVKEFSKRSDLAKKLLKFRKELSIEGIKKSNIIEISFKHKNPEIAADVVNIFGETYLDEHIQIYKNTRSLIFFKYQSQDLQNRLEKSEKELSQFKKDNNVTILEQQQQLLLKQISDLRVDLNSVLSREAETKNQISEIKKQLSQTPETIPQGEETNQNELLISRLEVLLMDLRIEEKKLQTRYTPQNRLVKNVKERIAIVEAKLAEHENKLYQKSTLGLNATYLRLKEELFLNQSKLKALAAKKEMQKGQLADYQNEIKDLNEMEMKLSALQQSIDLNRENYRLYHAKLEEARIEEAMDNQKINDVILMGRALPPLKPVSPKYFLNILLGLVLGSLGGISLAIIGDYLDDSLEKPEDVERILQLNFLAGIPDAEKKARLDHRHAETLQSDLRIPLS